MSFSWSSLDWRSLTVYLRDPVRLGVQGAAAAGATYAVMTPLGWPHLSWALISGLFVLQLNSDATRQSLWDRLIGTGLGSLVGLASLAVLPGESLAAWRVPAASFVAMMIAVFQPSRSYVVVAAIAVALESADPAWVGALERVRAIATGSAMAVAASLLIWREPARTRAVRALADALACCRDLAALLIPSVLRPDAQDDRDRLHARYHQSMRLARARIEDCRHGQGRAINRAARQLDRVWHDLVFLDRLSRRSDAAAVAAGDGAFDLGRQREVACRALEEARRDLLEGVKDGDEARPPASLDAPGGPGDPLRFVLEELERDLAALRQDIRNAR